MLIVEIFSYLKRRADKRPIFLKNFIEHRHHHGNRETEPLVEIIIPTRDNLRLLRACIESVIGKTNYKKYSITVVNNQSIETESLAYFSELSNLGVKILDFPHKFNYSSICNSAALKTNAEYVCFLNNDTEVLSPNWLRLMVDHAGQPGVGVVGSKLLYPNGAIQHLGVALGYTGIAGHVFAGENPTSESVSKIYNACFEVSAVTFACAVMSREKFMILGGLNERFIVGLNDVDLSLRAKEMDWANVICGLSVLEHGESKSRGNPNSMRNFLRSTIEVMRFARIHGPISEKYFSVLNQHP